MALGTIQEQITALEAELVLVKAQMAAASAGAQSVTLGSMSWSGVNYQAISTRRKEIEKSLQRLYRGGRGFVIDMSHTDPESEEPDSAMAETTYVNAT